MGEDALPDDDALPAACGAEALVTTPATFPAPLRARPLTRTTSTIALATMIAASKAVVARRRSPRYLERSRGRDRSRRLRGDTSSSVGLGDSASFASEGSGSQVDSAIARDEIRYLPNLANGQRTLLRWFDTDAFSQPASARFGNSGVGILRSAGVIHADLRKRIELVL